MGELLSHWLDSPCFLIYLKIHMLPEVVSERLPIFGWDYLLLRVVQCPNGGVVGDKVENDAVSRSFEEIVMRELLKFGLEQEPKRAGVDWIEQIVVLLHDEFADGRWQLLVKITADGAYVDWACLVRKAVQTEDGLHSWNSSLFWTYFLAIAIPSQGERK